MVAQRSSSFCSINNSWKNRRFRAILHHISRLRGRTLKKTTQESEFWCTMQMRKLYFMRVRSVVDKGFRKQHCLTLSLLYHENDTIAPHYKDTALWPHLHFPLQILSNAAGSKAVILSKENSTDQRIFRELEWIVQHYHLIH